MNKKNDIPLIALLTSIVFVLEQALTFLPNIKLTSFLIILYTKRIGYKKTMLIIFIHVLLDCILMGYLNPLFMFAMLIGWLFIPLLLRMFSHKKDNVFVLSIIGFISAFLYGWTFIIPNVIMYDINVLHYMIIDLPWALVMGSFSFIIVLWFYQPISKIFDLYIKRDE